MFSTKEFIEASRKFVCIRIETYENEASEAMVRKLLGGRFENTAFVVFDPTGTQTLSRSGRSPNQGLSVGRRKASNDTILDAMNRIAGQFQPVGTTQLAELQDFLSLKQSLNVASADQRLLILVNASEKDRASLGEKLKPVLADKSIIGKFHMDFLDTSADQNWKEVVRGADDQPRIMIVQSSQFGLDGKVVDKISLDQSGDEIKKALLAANKKFAKTETRKDYAQHVRDGRRQGINYKSNIPYGEDRDGDGEADQRRSRRGSRSGRRGR